MEKKSEISWGYLLTGILFILVSLIAFKDPASSLVAIVYVFAFFAIYKGAFDLFFRRKIHQYTDHKSTLLIVLGLFDIAVGIFLLFNVSLGLVALPFIFAIWFIVDSVISLALSDVFKLKSNSYYWFNVVLNLIGIVLGIMLLFNPISSALTLAFLVGFYFMVIGISFIVNAF